MARPKFVQARRTTLKVAISAAEASEIILASFTDQSGNALTMADFGDVGYITLNPGGRNEEIVSFTDFTVNADGTVTLDTGIVRGLEGVSPYSTGGTANPHSGGTVVVSSNNPQLYEAILDYIEGLALAGVGDASTTSAGVVEEATQAEIDADTAAGATTRRLFTNPSTLATSKYGTRLPSADQKIFLNAATGMLIPYAGVSAPTGFLLCDGTAYDNDTYSALALVLLGKFGYGTAVTFTAATSDIITASSHGLSDGNIIFVTTTGTLPAGLSVNTPYYVRDSTTNTFKVSTSAGGSAVDITSTGSGVHSFYNSVKVPDLRGTTPIGQGTKTLTFTFLDAAVNTGTDVITVDSNDTLHTGQAVALTTSGVLPTGLSATTYYIIRTSATTIKLATTVANANAGTAVDITAAAGGGTHTLTKTFTARTFAAVGGEETHALSDGEMPSHVHGLGDDSGGGSGASTTNNANAGTAGDTLSTGSDTPHNIMQPYLVVSWLIKT